MAIKWHIESRKITELKEWAKNPRLLTEKGIADLTKSITKFGLAEPIVINTDGTILGGHARIKVLKAQAEIKCDCYVPDRLFTEKEVEELNIRLNANTAGIWDTERLANEWNTDQLQEWGLDIPAFITNGEAIEDDFTIPEIIETKIVKGDLFELIANGLTHRLLCGDSCEKSDVEKLLDGNCPILCATDPPYGISYDANWRNEMDRANGKPYGERAIGKVTNDNKADWFEAFNLFKGNIIYCWHASASAIQFANDIMKAGFEIKNQIIWVKNNIVIGRGDYHWKHEPCWYAVRKGKNHNWQGSRKENTIWEIDKPMKSETGYSTQKPVECMSRPIRNNSAEGESVYDPFLGSGTTMVASHQLNRRCFGMEISPLYCAVILRRLKLFDNNIQIKCLNRNFDIETELQNALEKQNIAM